MTFPRYLAWLNVGTWLVFAAGFYLWAQEGPDAHWVLLAATLMSLLSILVRKRLLKQEGIALEVERGLLTYSVPCRACRGTGKLGVQVHVGAKGGGRDYTLLPPCPDCDGSGYVKRRLA